MSDHAKHVMIRGHIFTWESKAPFIPSGVSVFGAVEYDGQRDKIRCHECGEYFASLSHHVSHGAHDLTLPEYKRKHGLNLQTSLQSEEIKKNKGIASRERNSGNISMLRNSRPSDFQSPSRKTTQRSRSEGRNVDGRCAAQLHIRVTTLAAKLKRTPTTHELISAGINPTVLRTSLKVKTLSEAMGLIGLEPRAAGHRPDQEWL